MTHRTGTLVSRWELVWGLPIYARVSLDPVPADRPAVVLVPGLVVSSRQMVPTAVRLAPHHRVYAPDLPGFGRSAKPPHALDVPELADTLAAWMDTVGLDRAALLANSFGCQIVAELAMRHPERVERAVLVGPTMDPRGRAFHQQFVRWLIDSAREPMSLRSILIEDYLAAGLRRAVRTIQYALRDRIEERLPHVRVPTLVVRGARDPIVPQRWAEEATRLLPMGRLVVIPGAPHAVNYSAPSELVRVTLPFLDEGRPRARSSPAA